MVHYEDAARYASLPRYVTHGGLDTTEILLPTGDAKWRSEDAQLCKAGPKSRVEIGKFCKNSALDQKAAFKMTMHSVDTQIFVHYTFATMITHPQLDPIR